MTPFAPFTFLHTAATLLPWIVLLLGIYGLWPAITLIARVLGFLHRCCG